MFWRPRFFKLFTDRPNGFCQVFLDNQFLSNAPIELVSFPVNSVLEKRTLSCGAVGGNLAVGFPQQV